MSDIHMDIETLGTEEGSVILSIGALASDGEDGLIGRFFTTIDIPSQLRLGLRIDRETQDWWRHPDRAKAWELSTADPIPVHDALTDFGSWLEANDATHIWAKPPKFDCGLIEAACRAANIPVQWDHRAPKCLRTVLLVSGFNDKSVPFQGVEHHAFDDAYHQFRVWCEAMAMIRKP